MPAVGAQASKPKRHPTLPVPAAGLDANKARGGILPEFLSATFRAEVQYEEENMVRDIHYSSYLCMFDGVFCGKTEGFESDASESNGRPRNAYTPVEYARRKDDIPG